VGRGTWKAHFEALRALARSGTHVATWCSAATSALLLCAILGAPRAGAEAAAVAGKLQLYVMPDTQSWAWNQGGDTLAIWRSVVDALCQQRERFAMVLHTGDLVDTPRARPEEWRNALSVMQRLDACRMPYAIAFGNHDFDNYPPQQGVKAQGDEHWKALQSQLAYRPEETAPSGRSGLFPLAPGWFVLTLDFRPSPGDLAWAAAEIGERRGARFVALDHHCVDRTGISKPWCRKLFDTHSEIRIAISGHWLGRVRDAWREVPRPQGPPLIALYQNYQHVPDLAAWGVVVELDPAAGTLCVWSENLLSGAVGTPATTSSAVGKVAAGSPRRCFEGSPPVKDALPAATR